MENPEQTVSMEVLEIPVTNMSSKKNTVRYYMIETQGKDLF